MCRSVAFALAMLIVVPAAAQTGQIQSYTWGDGPVSLRSGAGGVRILRIVGTPIIEPNTGKRLKYLVVDQHGRQIGAVIDTPAGSDHSFSVTKVDGQIDSRHINVRQWAVATSGRSNGVTNYYGPEGRVRLIAAQVPQQTGTHYPTYGTFSNCNVCICR